jgi:hypothetical protein
MGRRRFLAGALGAAGVAGAAGLAACSSDDGGGGSTPTTARPGPAAGTDPDHVLAKPGSKGLVDEGVWQERVTAYLAFGTAEPHIGSPSGVGVHLARAHRDPSYTWDVDQVTVESFRDTFAMIDAWEDTRDFNLMYLHWVLALGEGDTASTRVPPATIAAIEQRFLHNRYRYDDPLPADRVDNQWFWSENHRIIGLTNEHLAGQRMPDRTFAITGKKGRHHVARSKPDILEWIEERFRFGFFEWHSNVYMLKNISPLITLVELADDPAIVATAAMALDLCFFDMAAHTHKGTYTASRGRTYKKDKMSARDENTFDSAKLLFDDTDLDFRSPTDGGATYLSAAKRYRPPQALLDIATDTRTSVVQERHGIFLDAAAPVTEHPKAPYGYDFDDPHNLPFWWSQGAIGSWQIARVSLKEAAKYRLFETELLAQVKQLSDLNGGDPDRIRAWEQKNQAIVNFGHLQEAFTYAWRGKEVSLASVLDHRPGEMRDQVHAWQATIDADALVFTTHPRTDRAESTDWADDEGPGYWTGEASMPRTAQHERAAIHIYAPAWDAGTDDILWSVFGYQPFTHAYVPQDHFDEVREEAGWVLARRGDGWVGLWSQRPTTWRAYDPARFATRGMVKPFDLVAEGGPDNVWIVEVGEAADGTFDDFASALVASKPTVTPTPEGVEVDWTSPSAGRLQFGEVGGFAVDGSRVDLHPAPRHRSPWASIDHLQERYDLKGRSARLTLDWKARSRVVS